MYVEDKKKNETKPAHTRKKNALNVFHGIQYNMI